MTDPRNCDLLAAYEMGLLEETERTAFEAHLPDCPDCLEEMYALAPAVSELRRDPGSYADRAHAHLPRDTFWSRLAEVFRWKPARILVPVVVAALLAVVVIMPQGGGSPYPGMALTDAPAYITIPVRAGQQDAWLADWKSGMERYQAADYAGAAGHLTKAEPLLAEAAKADPDRVALRDHARFYLGVSRTLAGDPVGGTRDLALAAESPLPPLRQKSLYFLAQASLLADDPDGAVSALEMLTGSPVFGARAREQMEQIRAAR